MSYVSDRIDEFKVAKQREVSLEFAKHEHLRALLVAARLENAGFWIDDEITACRWGIDHEGRVFRRITKKFLTTTKNLSYKPWTPGVRSFHLV